MIVLKHGNRDTIPYLMAVTVDCTGLKASFSDRNKAMRFVSRGAAIQVGNALRSSFGNFYPVELDG